MPGGLRAVALALALLVLTISASPAAAGKCPATKALPCIASKYYVTPDLSLALSSPSIPDLTVLGIDPAVDLRAVLPYNDAINLLRKRIPKEVHNCSDPILTGKQMVAVANSKKQPAWARGSGLKACKHVPVVEGYKNPPYYVFGAFEDLDSMTFTKLEKQKLPRLAGFQKYNSNIGPHMSMCVAVDPCAMDVFVGLDGVQKPVSVSGQGVSLAVVPTRFFYSWSVSIQPPEWRAPKLPPAFWQVEPTTLAAKGVDIPLGVLSIPRGRLFISGVSSQDKQVSLASLPSATMDLGGQLWAWVMFRDDTHLAVSLRLASGPNIQLWNKMPLPLREVKDLRGVDILTRRPTDQFWLRAAGQSIVASKFIKTVPAVGAVVKQVYSAAERNPFWRITRLDMYGGGPKGAAMRLQFGKSKYPLTPGVSRRGGTGRSRAQDELKEKRGGERRAHEGRGGRHYIHFCFTNKECGAELFSGCHSEHKVCKPKGDAMSAALAAAAAADSEDGSSSSGSGKDGDGKGDGKGDSKGDGKDKGGEEEAAAGEYKPGSQVVGERCGSNADCAAPLYCGEVKELGRKACLEKVR
ncbi:hypothetical protein ABPG75_013004 [Micractinium tetrahymenae]